MRSVPHCSWTEVTVALPQRNASSISHLVAKLKVCSAANHNPANSGERIYRTCYQRIA
jgi:hypothetical protein